MRALLEEYVPRVYRFALRLTGDRHQAEDLTQETFLRAWRSRGRLRDPARARPWLFRIAANLWRDQVRRGKRGPKRQHCSLDDREGAKATPDRKLTDQEEVERILQTMDSLPSRQREVLYLHACEELSLAEIAGILEISAEAVKASLSLARKRMRRQLKDVCEDHVPTT